MVADTISRNGLKSKIPLTWVPSDSCVVTVGRETDGDTVIREGTAYPVHQGEKVAILPTVSVQEVITLGQMTRAVDGPARDSGELFQRLCELLSKRVVEWDWTDMMGEPLPQPYLNPGVIAQLTNDELLWLISAAGNREAGDERKNGSGA